MRGCLRRHFTLAVLLMGAVALPLCGDIPCFQDVTITSLQIPRMNGTMSFQMMHNGCPFFTGRTQSNGGPRTTLTLGREPFGWVLEVMSALDCEGCFGCERVMVSAVEYTNPSMTPIPPATGWRLYRYSLNCLGGCDCLAEDILLPAPAISGGGPCTSATSDRSIVVPNGAEGFLDRGWPEGEEAPVVGELILCARYEIGELVLGCCCTVDSAGLVLDSGYLAVSWYAVTIGEVHDLREALDSRVVRPRSDGFFCFGIDTTGWACGYYDIRLGIPGEDSEWIRVEVVPPPE